MQFLSHSIVRLCVIALCALYLPVFAYAQTATGIPPSVVAPAVPNLEEALSSIPTQEDIRAAALRDFLELDVRPFYPAPRDKVSVTVASNLTDLNRAGITWTVNGVPQESGTGKTVFSFVAGGAGSVSRVSVSIRTAEGERITKSLTVRPADIDFMWEADTYTPPFYKGKAMITPGSTVRVSALPRFIQSSGAAVPIRSIVFLWRKENVPIVEASGLGKNTITLPAPIPFWESDVQVEASSVDGAFRTSRQIDFLLVRPELVFYEDSPLEGIKYERALSGSFDLSGREVSVRAEPYFFSREALRAGTLLSGWTVNGDAVAEPSLGITLRAEGGAGASRIGFSLRHPSDSYQERRAQFLVRFSDTEGVNF